MYPRAMRVKAVELLLAKVPNAKLLALAMIELEPGTNWDDVLPKVGIQQGALGDNPANADMQSLVAEVLVLRLGGAKKVASLLADERRRNIYGLELLGIKLFPSIELTPAVRAWLLTIPGVKDAFHGPATG